MATMKKPVRRILLALALLFALVALGALALPLWFPWVLGPVAARAGVRYSSYEREGYGRFVLHAVQYRRHGVEFRAGRVEGLLPLGWLWERYAAPDRTTFVLVEAWSLRLTSETQQASARASPTDRKTNSVVTVLREARTNLFLVESWVPRAELRRGIVQLPSGQLELPLQRQFEPHPGFSATNRVNTRCKAGANPVSDRLCTGFAPALGWAECEYWRDRWKVSL
jgi:hypothetical protein